MLTKGQKQLIHALLDKYERGTGYIQSKKPVQRIKLNLYNKGKSDFKFYDIEKSEIRNQYNEDVVALHKLRLVDFKWMAAEEGHIIAEVWLVFEQLGEAYRLIGRTPKGDTVDEVLLLLMEAQEKAVSFWLLGYLNSLIEAISRKRSVGSLLPGSLDETKDLLCALIAADHLSEDEILERVFSMRCFSDSKRFESAIRSRFIGVLKRYLDDMDEDTKDEEILRRVGIVKYPEQMEFCGAIQIELNGDMVNYIPLQYGATVNAKDVRMGKFSISSSVKRILFIENRANFVDYILNHKHMEELVIFHGGCYSPAKGLFFQKLIAASPPNTEFYHWGDIDYGGFSMLARLRRNIVPSIKAYRMNQEELIKYKDYAIVFGASYSKRIKRLNDLSELADCFKCLEFMISNQIKLEQEAMIAK